MDNYLEIYNKAREVPQEAIKDIKAGRLKGFSDISPMWRIKRLTEIFGPCGLGWWYVIKDKQIIEDQRTNQAAAFVDIDLYYRWHGEVSQPLPGTGGSSFVAQERSGPYMSDECFKMALTDAIGVAAKAIGIGADVYWSADRSKYSAVDLPFEDKPKKAAPVLCENCGQPLEPYPGLDGKEISVDMHVKRCQKVFGHVYCYPCIRDNKLPPVTDAAGNE